MSQDALTLAAIRDELTALLAGGRVQRVIRPTELSLGLEIYTGQRHQVLLSAENEGARIALTDERLRRGTETASPLQLLLRKYIRGARLTGIVQPELERVLRFEFVGPEGPADLVCEVMGRLSNLILVGEDGAILDAAKRIPSRINRYRVVLPGEFYVPPPPQNKAHPLEMSVPALEAALEAESGPLFRRLVRAAFGISPLLAREIVHRATGDTRASWPVSSEERERLHAVLREMMGLPQTHAWQPSMGFQEQDGQRVPVAYAPYLLTHMDAHEPLESISRAGAVPMGQERVFDPYAQVRTRLREQISEATKRQQARLASLQKALVPPEQLDALQFRGNAILAMAWTIEPGQDKLVVTRAQVTGETGPKADEEVAIDLDPGLSPSENAQAIFQAYRKREAAAEQVPQRIAKARHEISYLEQLLTDVNLAETRPELDQVAEAMQEAGHLPQKKRRSTAQTGAPLRIYCEDESLILVGRNSRQNEEITFRQSSPQDLWLHAHGVAGAHVIVRSGGRSASEETLRRAASLAAYYSAARAEGQVQVDITERRHVRHIPGGRPGMVTYRHEETMVVTPEPPPQQADSER